MEDRKLLSGLMAVLTNHAHSSPPISALALELAANGGNPNFPGTTSPLLGQGQPTPRELARETFQASFSGPFAVGPGRFTDQAQIVFSRGVGTSTAFFHGNYDMAIVTPVDPTAPLTGLAVLNDKNTNGSGIIGLDLTGDPHNVDKQGRPLQMTFTNDANIYSGTFFVDAASGTVDIRYHGGAASVRFRGLVYTSGLTNPLKNSDLVSRGGRFSPRSGHP
jgi:hypothetical protein